MTTSRQFEEWHRSATAGKARTWRPSADESQVEKISQVSGKRGPGKHLGDMSSDFADFWGRIVMLDFILGILLVFNSYILVAGIKGEIIVGALLIALGSARVARLKVSSGGPIMILASAVMLFVVLETMHNNMPWTQRTIRMAILIMVAATIGTGRINARSLIIGANVGVLLNIPAFYAGLTPNDYPPYLTGFFRDKNVAGMYYALFGILMVMVLRSPRVQCAWAIVMFGIIFLTGSRTSLGAFAAAYAWILIRNRMGIFYRLMSVLFGYYALNYMINNLANNSVFGDRAGDDWYRRQVDHAMQLKADATPWYGMGLNSGQVQMGERVQWFHNSYLLAFVEGGYPLLIAVLIAYVLIAMGLLDRRTHISTPLVVIEGATVVILVCAWKLGEAFITIGGALTFGLALAYRLGVDTDFASWERKDPLP